jgi:uncharacterized cupin superfamily protein
VRILLWTCLANGGAMKRPGPITALFDLMARRLRSRAEARASTDGSRAEARVSTDGSRAELSASTEGSRAQARASTRALGPASVEGAVGFVLALGIAACDVKPPHVQTSHVFHDDLSFSPIPAEWVLEGKPQARAKDVVQANEDGLRVAIWDCSAGKFRWYFNGDEFVHILEGSVTVSDEHGRTRTLKPGDVAYFQAGVHSVWQVDKYVKKLALVRDNSPSLAWRARRKLGQLYGAL